MRAVIINGTGSVIEIIDLAGKTIDPDGAAARGPAVYTVEGPEGIEEVEYEAIVAAPPEGLIVASETAGIGWTWTGEAFEPPPVDLEQVRAARLAEVNARAAMILAAGAPAAGGLHVALDDSSRADLTAMATTALAAIAGALTWPESYALGWIAIENTRVPLATPVDGLGFADAVGNYYAHMIQNRRDLKDALLAAESPAALAAVDIDAGWPAA